MNQLVLAAALLSLVAAPVLADPPAREAPEKAEKAEKAKNAKNAKNVTFRVGSQVDGDRPSATDGPMIGRTLQRFAGLIRLRRSFRSEILESAEGI